MLVLSLREVPVQNVRWRVVSEIRGWRLTIYIAIEIYNWSGPSAPQLVPRRCSVSSIEDGPGRCHCEDQVQDCDLYLYSGNWDWARTARDGWPRRQSAVVMPKYYCDYCDRFLTHDSFQGRKQHNRGKKHQDNIRIYFSQFLSTHGPGGVPLTEMYPNGVPPYFGMPPPMPPAVISLW